MTRQGFATPEEAEAAFYAAFEQTDLAAMMAVWAEDDNIVCVHPLGPTLVGRSAIEQSWAAIFQGSPQMRFRVEKQRCAEDAALAIHTVHEHIDLVGQQQPTSTVIATNVYQRAALGWYMILHHASPGPTAGTEQTPTLH